MSTATIAVIAENAVLLAVVAARWSLLRQGGGLQEKTPPVPKAPAKAKPRADQLSADGTQPMSITGHPSVGEMTHG